MTQIIGPNGHDFTDVAACLSQFKDETIVFVHNPGNAGDNLINLGTYRLFDQLGLRYESGTIHEDYPGRVVVYSGGGALIASYPGADQFFRRNHATCKALILLPHTVRVHEDLIAQMDARCHLFAREAETHAFLSAHVTEAHLYMAHDMVFMVDRAYIDTLRWDWGDLRARGLLGSWLKMLIKFRILAMRKGPTLWALRTDLETDTQPTNPDNVDLSKMFGLADMHEAPCHNVARALTTVLTRFGDIRTDRLHIAIFSALLGLPVEMRDNNYGKNRGIYENSMAGRFDNVRFTTPD